MSQEAINKAVKKGNSGKGEYVDLCMICPAKGCHGNDKKASRWRHKQSQCQNNKYMEISQYGHVRCKDNHGDAFINWKWACSRHRGDFRETDEQYLKSSLHSVLAHGTFQNIDRQIWFLKLCKNVCAQFGVEEDDESDDDIKTQDITNALVIMICIEEYEGDANAAGKCSNLSGTQIDRRNMTELWVNKYNYDAICNKSKKCTLNDAQTILANGQSQFLNGGYDGIIVIFSGHGSKDSLILSDYYESTKINNQIYYKYNKIQRSYIEAYFGGENVKNKVDKIKIYLVDACRGHKGALPIDKDNIKMTPKGNNAVQNNEEQKIHHPNENRMIFYPNTEPYVSYDGSNGGALMYSFYSTMMDDENKNKNFLQLQDIIRKKADQKLFSCKDDQGVLKEYCVKIETKTTMDYEAMQKMYFREKNTQKDKEFIAAKNAIKMREKINLQFL
eukprot:410394_1